MKPSTRAGTPPRSTTPETRAYGATPKSRPLWKAIRCASRVLRRVRVVGSSWCAAMILDLPLLLGPVTRKPDGGNSSVRSRCARTCSRWSSRIRTAGLRSNPLRLARPDDHRHDHVREVLSFDRFDHACAVWSLQLERHLAAAHHTQHVRQVFAVEGDLHLAALHTCFDVVAVVAGIGRVSSDRQPPHIV